MVHISCWLLQLCCLLILSLFLCTDDNLNTAKNTDIQIAITTNKYLMQVSVFSSTDILNLYMHRSSQEHPKKPSEFSSTTWQHLSKVQIEIPLHDAK